MDEIKPSWKGPYGHKQRLRLILPLDKVTPEKVQKTGCVRIGETNDGHVILDWPYRTMTYRGDDESALIAAEWMLRESFGIWLGEFTIDRGNYVY